MVHCTRGIPCYMGSIRASPRQRNDPGDIHLRRHHDSCSQHICGRHAYGIHNLSTVRNADDICGREFYQTGTVEVLRGTERAIHSSHLEREGGMVYK